MLVLVCLVPSTIFFLKQGRLFLPGRATLLDVLPDGDIQIQIEIHGFFNYESPLTLQKSLHSSSSDMVSSSSFASCSGFPMAGTSQRCN